MFFDVYNIKNIIFTSSNTILRHLFHRRNLFLGAKRVIFDAILRKKGLSVV